MIQDQIVVGIRDSSLSAKLRMDLDLTREKAKRVVRQQEAVQGQQAILNIPEGEFPLKLSVCRSQLRNPKVLGVSDSKLLLHYLNQVAVVSNAHIVEKGHI